MKKYLILISLTLVLMGLGANQILAFEAPIIPKPDYLPGPSEKDQTKGSTEGSGSNTRKILVEKILPNFAVGFVGFIAMTALVFLVIGGVRFVTAYGNEEAVEKAKNQVTYALAGLIVALLSYTIVSIIANLKFEDDETRRDPPTSTTSYIENLI